MATDPTPELPGDDDEDETVEAGNPGEREQLDAGNRDQDSRRGDLTEQRDAEIDPAAQPATATAASGGFIDRVWGLIHRLGYASANLKNETGVVRNMGLAPAADALHGVQTEVAQVHQELHALASEVLGASASPAGGPMGTPPTEADLSPVLERDDSAPESTSAAQ